MGDLKEIASTQKKERFTLFLVSLMIGVTTVGQAYLFVKIVDDIFLQKQSFTAILPYLGGLLLVLFARTYFNYLSRKIGVHMAANVKGNFRCALLEKFTKNPVLDSVKGQSGK